MKYHISDTMKTMQGSAIREMFKTMAKPGIISFAGGNPSPLTFPVDEIKEIAQRVLTQMPSLCLQYGITEGYTPLIQKVEERLRQQGIYQEGSNTIITTGGQQGLDLAVKSILNPGETILVEEPSFIGALNAFRTYGAVLKGIPVEEDGMDMEKLEEVLKSDDKVRIIYVIPTFQNPTGITMSLEKRKKLLSLAYQYNVVIFEDNPYGELRFKGENVPTLKSLDTENAVMYFGSFSKILAPGLRLGFTHGIPEIMEKMVVAKQVNDVHTNLLTQVIAYEWLSNYDIDAHIKKARELYGHQCELMLSEMDKHFPSCVKYTRPEGGLFIWCTLPEGVDAAEFVKKGVEKNVAFVPGSNFMTDMSKPCNCFRLNYSTMTDDKIIEGIGILADVLKENL